MKFKRVIVGVGVFVAVGRAVSVVVVSPSEFVMVTLEPDSFTEMWVDVLLLEEECTVIELFDWLMVVSAEAV